MIKLERTNTADKLQAARNQLENAEKLILALTELRTKSLKECDEAKAAQVDEEIANERDHIARLKDQIVLLEELAAGDEQKRRRIDYDNALALVQSKWLPGLKSKLADVEKAIAGVATAVEALAALQRDKLRDWPAELPRPLKSQMSVDIVERAIADAFATFNKQSARWHSSLEDKCAHVRAKAAKLTGAQDRLYQEMIEDLKAKAPKVGTETEVAA
jgi:hypothetical protein